jgi:long-chain acyl-CoA synthetase
MTEASPVTHVGYIAPPEMNRPASIGQPLALTDCRILDVTEKDLDGKEVAPGEPGELVMRGPQIMLGYWKEPQGCRSRTRPTAGIGSTLPERLALLLPSNF